jgi:rod shape-determining protein MreC
MVRFSYFLLGLCLFALINVPEKWADLWRCSVVSALSPAWQSVAPRHQKNRHSDGSSGAEISALQSQYQTLQELFMDEKRLQGQAEALATLVGQNESQIMRKDSIRRFERLKRLLALQYSSVPAQVVFREPSSWSSTIWVSVGEADNRAAGKEIIGLNSPVLANQALVGVVEYVGETQSRVRLISDAGLVCAVRSVRGGMQNRELFHQVQSLLMHSEVRLDLFTSREEQARFVDMLAVFKNRLIDEEEKELAKGEICGGSTPLFRSCKTILKGMGFNYDFSDEAGPARDLRSGRSLGNHSASGIKLIQQGDLLVTSGLDGVFPAMLPVAIATVVAPLKEGSFSYELEARPAAGDLMDLQIVFVMPPIGAAHEDFVQASLR